MYIIQMGPRFTTQVNRIMHADATIEMRKKQSKVYSTTSVVNLSSKSWNGLRLASGRFIDICNKIDK